MRVHFTLEWWTDSGCFPYRLVGRSTRRWCLDRPPDRGFLCPPKTCTAHLKGHKKRLESECKQSNKVAISPVSRRYSVVLSNTRFSSGSNPFRTPKNTQFSFIYNRNNFIFYLPETSRPPANLTRMCFSRYFDKSRILSLRFFSLLPSFCFLSAIVAVN